MTDGLFDPFRHNAWATRKLIAFCRELGPERLRAAAPGTYGTVLETLQHMLGAEHRYLSRIAGGRPEWSAEPEEIDDLGELNRMAEDLATTWEGVITAGFDSDRVVSFISRSTGEPNEAAAGMLVAQTLHHGNEHRAQIFSFLSSVGLDPPELDGWGYGLETGRFRELGQDASRA